MGPPALAGPSAGSKSRWLLRQPWSATTWGGASPQVAPNSEPPANDLITRETLLPACAPQSCLRSAELPTCLRN